MSYMIQCPTWFTMSYMARLYLQRLLSANPKGSRDLLIAYPPILRLLCSFALDAIQTMQIGS